MKHIILVLSFIFSGTAFANDCSSMTQQILSANDLSGVTAKDVMFGKEKMNGKKVKQKREALIKKFVYSGPYFDDIDENVNYFLDQTETFTSAKEYSKGKTRVHVFEDQDKKTTMGYALDMGGKRSAILALNPDCSLKEAIYFDDGTRCYVKSHDCERLLPLTEKKLKEQCSYLHDTSATAVGAFTRACGLFSTKVQEKAPAVGSSKETPKKSGTR